MEPRFGADFSAVRVHTDGEAVQMNRDLGAQAFAHGSDVYFGAGKEPGNNELTAHELTHVVQHGGIRQPEQAAIKTTGIALTQESDQTRSLVVVETEKNNLVQKSEYRGASPPPTGKTNPSAIIGLDKFIKLVKNVEESYPNDTPSQIVTRIRNLYYSSEALAFQALLPNADNDELVWTDNPFSITKVPGHLTRVVRVDQAIQGVPGVSEQTFDHLTAQGDENAKGDNPSPYIFLPNGQKVDIGHLLLGLDALSRSELIAKLRPRMIKFSNLYGGGQLEAARAIVTGKLFNRNWPHTDYMLNKFLDYVENNLLNETGI